MYRTGIYKFGNMISMKFGR